MRIVTMPPSAFLRPAPFVRQAERAQASMVEIRTDLLSQAPSFRSSLPLLLAVRTKTCHQTFLDLKPEYVDCDLVDASRAASLCASCMSTPRLIISHHDYRRTPSMQSMYSLVQKMCSYTPWMIKIAVMVRSLSDLERIISLRDFLNKKSIRSVVIGMGPLGHLTRVLAAAEGQWVYTYLDGYEPSAQGQVPLSIVRHIRRMRKSKICGIVGGLPCTTSLSPLLHSVLMERHRVDAVYTMFPLASSTLTPATLATLHRLGVYGLSVTAPFKRSAVRYARVADPLVQTLKTANTLTRTSRGWRASLTDVYGIQMGYPVLRSASSVAIIGAGGVVPSVIEALSILAPDACVAVYARDVKKATRALAPFSVDVRSMQSLKKSHHDVLICAIPEDIVLPIPSAQSSKLKAQNFVAIDLRYGKRTRFMIDAEKKGYTVYDGLPMLLHQALRQCEIFHGKNTTKSDVHLLHTLLKAHSS